MSPDRLGVSPWAELNDPDDLEEAVYHLSRTNVTLSGQLIEAQIGKVFVKDLVKRDALLKHVKSLTSPHRSIGQKRSR